MPRHLILRTLSAVCTSATEQTLELDAWDPRDIIRWDQIAAFDVTTGVTIQAVGLKRSGVVYKLRAEKIANVGESTELHGSLYAPGDFVPCAIFQGATLGDTLQLSACGEVVEGPGIA